MTPFRVEVSGTWEDQRMRTEQSETQVFLVAANGPMAAQVAATQIFGGEAARRRFRAMPTRTARVIDPETEQV
jgi:hypothetical protein